MNKNLPLLLALLIAAANAPAAHIAILDNALPQYDRAFTIALQNPQNAQLAADETAVTIRDDDPDVQARLEQTEQNITEGETASFQVRLSGLSGKNITLQVQYDGDLQNFAAPDEVAFAPGQQTRPIAVQTTDDTQWQGDRFLDLTLTTPLNATLAEPLGARLQIRDNETPPPAAFARTWEIYE